jgi:GWxTD domain-containing protein
MKKIFLLFALIALGGIELAAQTLTPKSQFVLNLDYARFRNDDKTGYLEVYYGFYPNSLTYNLSAGAYHAGVKLSTMIRNQATNTPAIQQNVTLPLAIADTSSASFRYPFTTQTGFAVPFGEYTLEVVAVDSLDSARRDSINLPIGLQPFAEGLSVSDLELCSRVQASNKKDDPFYKNSLEVVPNPSLVFGVATHPMLFNYAELYHLDPAATYTAKYQVVASDGKIVKESSRPRKYGMNHGVEAGSINVTAVMPGKYSFRLLLLDQSAREVVRAEKTFFVFNPHLQAQAAAASGGAVPFDAAQLAGLSGAELDLEFQQARYLATSDEAKMFAQLESDIGKREFLTKFWAEIEAGRSERPPMKRTEYLRRIAHANQNYKALLKDGWRTDRGRVYILYGEPDQITRVPGEAGSRPYQTWSYFNIEKGVEFVFVDRLGNSDYQLVHSTKRGELQDEGWERFLQ